jgi:hypothetical protein
MIEFSDSFVYKYSYSQWVIITHNQSSAKSFFLECRALVLFSFTFYGIQDCPSNWTTLTLIFSRHGPRIENTDLLLLSACLLGPPRERHPASPLGRWLLPSHGLGANHIYDIALVLLVACLFEYVYLSTFTILTHVMTMKVMVVVIVINVTLGFRSAAYCGFSRYLLNRLPKFLFLLG